MVKHTGIHTIRRCALALVLALAAGGAAARPGYVTSSAGVVKSGFGLCWHTHYWTPDEAFAPCDAVPKAQALPAAVTPKPQPQVAAEPKTAPVPPLIAAKPAPAITRLALDSEVLFNFDSAELRPSGREKLEQIALKLHGANIESLQAVGYADRIGSESYNDVLSRERAAAVADYLAQLGLDRHRMRVAGRGESEPITGGQCRGLGAEDGDNLKLVACLQPDRRVELEVSGAKRIDRLNKDGRASNGTQIEDR